ncbi:MAG: hypothetical protein ACJ73S_25415 [Mycobacteriales bacterium]|jgi:hypothetical protein
MARKLRGFVGVTGLAVGLVAAAGAVGPAYAGVYGHNVDIHKTNVFAPHRTDIDIHKKTNTNIFAPRTDIDIHKTDTNGVATSAAGPLCKFSGIIVEPVRCVGNVTSEAKVVQAGNGDHNAAGNDHYSSGDDPQHMPAYSHQAYGSEEATGGPAVVAPVADPEPVVARPVYAEPVYREPVEEGWHSHHRGWHHGYRHGWDVNSGATGVFDADDSNGINVGGFAVNVPITVACNAVNVIGTDADSDC